MPLMKRSAERSDGWIEPYKISRLFPFFKRDGVHNFLRKRAAQHRNFKRRYMSPADFMKYHDFRKRDQFLDYDDVLDSDGFEPDDYEPVEYESVDPPKLEPDYDGYSWIVPFEPENDKNSEVDFDFDKKPWAEFSKKRIYKRFIPSQSQRFRLMSSPHRSTKNQPGFYKFKTPLSEKLIYNSRSHRNGGNLKYFRKKRGTMRDAKWMQRVMMMRGGFM